MKKIVAIAALLALVLTLAVPAGAENAAVEKAQETYNAVTVYGFEW